LKESEQLAGFEKVELNSEVNAILSMPIFTPEVIILKKRRMVQISCNSTF
jgi:hypothetical protein